MLSALVVIFDYGLKFSGLKIPFPWMPFLKFDFTGVPISFSFLMFDLSAGAYTSLVACVAIVIRSGELVGAVMKGIAELSTVSGMALALKLPNRYRRVIAVLVGIAVRIVAMSLTNLIVLPAYYGVPLSVAANMLPMLGLFNAMQGALTVSVGYALHEAYKNRVGSVV